LTVGTTYVLTVVHGKMDKFVAYGCSSGYNMKHENAWIFFYFQEI